MVQSARHQPHRFSGGPPLFWLVWSGIALVFALQWLTYRQQIGAPAWVIVLFATSFTFIWAGLSLPLRLLLQKQPNRLFYLPVFILSALLHLSIYYTFYRIFLGLTGIDYYKQTWLAFIRSNLFFDLILLGLLISALYLILLTARVREGETRAETLEKELVSVQLQSLKMQLQPHFLFNTLHSVTALMDEDITGAKTMVARLSEFLRATLDLPLDGWIPLARELHLAGLYLQIEGVRFSDRLKVTLPPEASLPQVRVPALILQPLLGNAVKHGIAPFARQGEVRVWFEVKADGLEISVENRGSAAPEANRDGLGLGLNNVRRRLQHLYGNRGGLNAGPLPEGGYRATLLFPLEGV